MSKKDRSNHEKFKKTFFASFYKHIKKKEKEENKDREAYLNLLSSKLNIPSDILTGAPIITIIGKNEASIENYKRIIEYTNKNIKVLTYVGCVLIEGKNMKISYFGKDEMKIIGRIDSIRYTGVDGN